MDIFDQLSQEAQKAGNFIAEKATAAKDYMVATWNTAELRNKINQLYRSIGEAVYKAHTTETDTAEEIEAYLTELAALHEALRDKEEARQALRNRKLCPGCGKSVAKENAFCPHCGTQIQ